MQPIETGFFFNSLSIMPLKSIQVVVCIDSQFLFIAEAMAPTPVLLPGESQGRGSLVGCRLWGRTESDTEVT